MQEENYLYPYSSIMSSMFTLEMLEDEIASNSGGSRFFVCTIEGHYKYYITDISSRTVKYGRIGTAPVTMAYASEYAVEKKIREKLNKGYREITSKEDLKRFYLDNI